MQVLLQRDSKPWQVQVWASFLIATFLCTVGLLYLPGKDLDRAFMIMGYQFCLFTAFVLAKFVRDQEQAKLEGRVINTPLFKFVAWGGFFLAMDFTAWGLLRMEISETYKAFLGVSWLYLISSAFTLAKMLRDKHEADNHRANAPSRTDPPKSHGF